MERYIINEATNNNLDTESDTEQECDLETNNEIKT